MIREYSIELLEVNPNHLKDVMAILEKNDYISKGEWSFILQPRKYSKIQHGLLLADPVYLQKVLNVFEKYLPKENIINLIVHKFADISIIKESGFMNKEIFNHFIKVVEILGTHIKIKDVLLERIEELIDNHGFSSEIYNALSEMSSTSSSDTMKKSLTKLPLSEFTLSIYEVENSMTEKPSNPISLH